MKTEITLGVERENSATVSAKKDFIRILKLLESREPLKTESVVRTDCAISSSMKILLTFNFLSLC